MNRANTLSTTLRLTVASFAIMAVAAGTAQAQQAFSTPEQAVDALVNANRSGDKAALVNILGAKAEKLVSSGDPVADKEGRERFVAAYDTAHKLESEGVTEKILIVGEEEWPLPIPLVRIGGAWKFDTKAGEQEILNRRIGRNELNVIEVMHEYVAAQREYADSHDHRFAEHFMSTPGTHDGLYWPVNAGEDESPLGPLIAGAQAEGYQDIIDKKHAREPYHGYYFKILNAQGKHARGGAENYIVGGKMTGGFALIAFPARYGDSGIMSFVVNQNGIVYEKDLGSKTAKIASRITAYDPDGSWKLPSAFR